MVRIVDYRPCYGVLKYHYFIEINAFASIAPQEPGRNADQCFAYTRFDRNLCLTAFARPWKRVFKLARY